MNGFTQEYLTMQKWITLSSETIASYRVFSIKKKRQKSPIRDRENDFFIIESPDWVNVIPLLDSGEIIFIEQYRHGTDEITLEVPGGCVDPKDDSPLKSAERELREETGFTASKWTHLGSYSPNPAILNNRCHAFLAEGLSLVGNQELDLDEEISIRKYNISQIEKLIRNGVINHSIIITSLYLLKLHLKY